MQRDLEALEARNEEVKKINFTVLCAIDIINNFMLLLLQLTSILMRTEAELKTTQLSQARVESANSAKLAAQSAG